MPSALEASSTTAATCPGGSPSGAGPSSRFAEGSVKEEGTEEEQMILEAQGEDLLADRQQEQGRLQELKDQLLRMMVSIKAGTRSNLSYREGEMAALATKFGGIFAEIQEHAQEIKKRQRFRMV